MSPTFDFETGKRELSRNNGLTASLMSIPDKIVIFSELKGEKEPKEGCYSISIFKYLHELIKCRRPAFDET